MGSKEKWVWIPYLSTDCVVVTRPTGTCYTTRSSGNKVEGETELEPEIVKVT